MVVTCPSVTAGSGVTLALTRVAGFSFPVFYAVAVKVVEQVDTQASILTWVPAALVHINVTQGPLPAVWAETLERVDPINAGSSILTWR